MKSLALYLHIPYCVRKCAYCDFLSYGVGSDGDGEAGGTGVGGAGDGEGSRDGAGAQSGRAGGVAAPSGAQEAMGRYLAQLRREIRLQGRAYRGYVVTSVFLGGGTPSILPEGAVAGLLDAVGESFRLGTAQGRESDATPQGAMDGRAAEVTLEANPGTLTAGKLAEYRAAGVNRLSLGLQSTQDAELARLGRIHRYADFLESYALAREAGFRNINVDLMSGLPGQTLQSWRESLERVVVLGPEHISAYALILEEGTALYESYRAGDASDAATLPPLPEEETEREMVHLAHGFLAARGYAQYEISNYAREGYACRHNLVYWERGDYLGLGLGAASCVGERRWRNTQDPGAYLRVGDGAGETGLDGIRIEQEDLSIQAQRFEAIMLGLRLMRGIDCEEYARRYRERIEEARAGQIAALAEAGLLEVTRGRILLTERGQDLADYVIRELVGDAAAS